MFLMLPYDKERKYDGGDNNPCYWQLRAIFDSQHVSWSFYWWAPWCSAVKLLYKLQKIRSAFPLFFVVICFKYICWHGTLKVLSVKFEVFAALPPFSIGRPWNNCPWWSSMVVFLDYTPVSSTHNKYYRKLQESKSSAAYCYWCFDFLDINFYCTIPQTNKPLQSKKTNITAPYYQHTGSVLIYRM